ncbi:cob(I)yrinic acid a,c-diamide adenosyltransferase [Spiroplasma endosymbiont of Labia minor]|uniref:cob(I)yrinic acid a,c-diamide adenosyltransferase n=1 Tax=Spiroplasma endosymbiont of Labia minor TaxID=3066305 RepID=UPI0030CE0639
MINAQTHFYLGDGRGKTSILNGSLLRAVGNNLKVAYVRFLKNWPTGEINIIKNKFKSEIDLFDFYNSSTKFTNQINEEELKTLKKEVENGINVLINLISSNQYDLILIDELFGCYDAKLISKNKLIKLLQLDHKNTELMFSGHSIDYEFFKYADLISIVSAEKHYYNTKKLLARKGIEF